MSRRVFLLIVLTGLLMPVCVPGSAFSEEKTLFEQLSVPLVALAPQPVESRSFSELSSVPPVLSWNDSPRSEQSPVVFSPRRPGRVRGLLQRGLPRIVSDYRNLYGLESLMNFGVALGGAAILANTSIDREFRDWFLRESDPHLDRGGNPWGKHYKFSWFAKGFGETYMVGLFAVSALGYCLTENLDSGKGQPFFGQYTVRTTRAYLAGFPGLLLGQSMLGAGRPGSGDSKWRFFDGGMAGISGHSFIGAVPFITAAQMTDNYWLKGVFYTCSTFSAWSRLYWDAHYLSQVFLGWYVAYLSARAVSKTEGVRLPRGLTVFPVCDGDGVGFGFSFRR